MKPDDTKTPMSDEEKKTWEKLDIKHFYNRLNEIENSLFIADIKKSNPDEKSKWECKGLEIYKGLVERMESIDPSKLDERFSPDAVKETYEVLIGMGQVMDNYSHDALADYLTRFKKPREKFDSPRYRMYRNMVGESERKA
jgi:hypothetical protein